MGLIFKKHKKVLHKKRPLKQKGIQNVEKSKNSYSVVANTGFTDEGDGVVSFPNGLTITDNTTQRNGTRYDIESMSLDSYGNQLTADHDDTLRSLIGKVVGVKKSDNKVTVDKIIYAVKENPYARVAYDLMVGGFSNSFSIETLGRLDPDTGVYLNAELCGLSQVVTPNNYNAHVNSFNEIVHNSLQKAKAEGLEVDGLEDKLVIAQKEENMAKETKGSASAEEFVEVKVNATEDQTPEAVVEETQEEVTQVEDPATQPPVDTTAPEEKVEDTEEVTEDEVEEAEEAPVVETNANPEEDGVEVEEAEEESEDVEVEDAEPVVEDEAPEEKVENNSEVEEEDEAAEEVAEPEEKTEEVVEEKTENKKEIEMTKEDVQALIDSAVKNALDAKVEEPVFKESAASADAVVQNQFALAVASTRDLNVEAHNQLRELNKANLEALVEAGKVDNSVKLEDLGNFVIGPDVLSEVQGRTNSYRALIDATEWRETNALKFAWLSRGNTVDMQNVSTGYSGGPVSTGPIDDDDLLKPYGEPTWAPHDDELEELAYVTAVALATIKFAAVDIMADIAKQFTLDYDKKRAQLVIARLQQAVNAQVGRRIAYTGSSADLSTAIAEAADVTTVGSLIMSNKTKAVLLRDAIDAENYGLVAELNQGSVYGTNFITVPSDLLPTLGTSETRTFLVHGAPVVIEDAIFYADMSAFTGRTSGGLSYDVDGRASYEVNGEVRSAFQRNEVVVRGSFFRGGVVTEPELVSSLTGASTDES